jgi:hypothetical protein
MGGVAQGHSPRYNGPGLYPKTGPDNPNVKAVGHSLAYRGAGRYEWYVAPVTEVAQPKQVVPFVPVSLPAEPPPVEVASKALPPAEPAPAPLLPPEPVEAAVKPLDTPLDAVLAPAEPVEKVLAPEPALVDAAPELALPTFDDLPPDVTSDMPIGMSVDAPSAVRASGDVYSFFGLDRGTMEWIWGQVNSAGYIQNTWIYAYQGTQRARRQASISHSFCARIRYCNNKGPVT